MARVVLSHPSVDKPATILFLGANPSGTTRLALDREAHEIDQRLRSAEHRDAFRIEQAWAVRATDLQETLLRHRPSIVHFSGHGSAAGEILLEEQTGQARPVTTSALENLFRTLRGNIRCVVLNACFSEGQARAIAEHIDYVIGMTTAVDDRSAIAFAGAFYQALGYGENVQMAFDLGCGQIALAGLGHAHAPQLLMREGVRAQDFRFAETARGAFRGSFTGACVIAEATLCVAYEGRVHDFATPVVRFGRGHDNDVVLRGAIVSEHHAEAHRRVDRSGQAQWDVVDLNSTNGTYLRGARIYRHPLHSGDVLTFGSGGPSVMIDFSAR